MRPDPIVIPGLGKARAASDLWFAARSPTRQRPAAPEAFTFRDSGGRSLKRPALQGYACLYNSVFQKNGKLQVFVQGCFPTIHNPFRPAALWLDHNPQQVIGSDGLELSNDLQGLAFRFPLVSDARSSKIQRFIDTSSKICVSVGCLIEEKEEREMAGHKVTLITKATLEEISLVEEGAVSRTFATLVDMDDVDPCLWAEARKASFQTAMASTNILARIHRLSDGLRRLTP